MENRFIHNKGFRMALVIPAISILLLTASSALGAGGSKTYTLDADFDEGTLINVNHDAPYNDQLQLIDSGEAFSFIWVAASGRGTIVKIDTETGAILGEYKSAPNGRARNAVQRPESSSVPRTSSGSRFIRALRSCAANLSSSSPSSRITTDCSDLRSPR